MRPECKVAAALLTVLAVVAAPRESAWAYAAFAALLAALTARAGVAAGFLLRRLALEVPFVAFALALPFLGGGERVALGPLSLSTEGLWAAWNILVKATLGLWVTLLLAATTPVADILRGLERLKVPAVITTIAGFMVRYGDVILGEARRMRIAREARGYDGRWLWEARALAGTAGALFIRSFERGERVYLAMLARGFAGSLPELNGEAATRRQWLGALSVPAVTAAIAASAWILRA
jgi:cobalt/nickel transport system permease protein